jgi:hypothetical protein
LKSQLQLLLTRRHHRRRRQQMSSQLMMLQFLSKGLKQLLWSIHPVNNPLLNSSLSTPQLLMLYRSRLLLSLQKSKLMLLHHPPRRHLKL